MYWWLSVRTLHSTVLPLNDSSSGNTSNNVKLFLHHQCTICGTRRVIFEIPKWLIKYDYIIFCAKYGFKKCYSSHGFQNCFSSNNSKNHLWFRIGYIVIFNSLAGIPNVCHSTCVADGTYFLQTSSVHCILYTGVACALWWQPWLSKYCVSQ